MALSRRALLGAVLAGLLTSATANAQNIECPAPLRQVEQNVRGELDGQARAAMRSLNANFRGAVETTVVNLLAQYPNADRVAVLQNLNSIFCQFLNSENIAPERKFRMIIEMSEEIRKYLPSGATLGLIDRIEGFWELATLSSRVALQRGSRGVLWVFKESDEVVRLSFEITSDVHAFSGQTEDRGRVYIQRFSGRYKISSFNDRTRVEFIDEKIEGEWLEGPWSMHFTIGGSREPDLSRPDPADRMTSLPATAFGAAEMYMRDTNLVIRWYRVFPPQAASREVTVTMILRGAD